MATFIISLIRVSILLRVLIIRRPAFTTLTAQPPPSSAPPVRHSIARHLTTPATSAPWRAFHRNIYFSCYGLGRLYEYNTTSNAVSTVYTAPNDGTVGEVQTLSAIGDYLYMNVAELNN